MMPMVAPIKAETNTVSTNNKRFIPNKVFSLQAAILKLTLISIKRMAKKKRPPHMAGGVLPNFTYLPSSL